jgi:V8-like Glu-specific endopeptidase
MSMIVTVIKQYSKACILTSVCSFILLVVSIGARAEPAPAPFHIITASNAEALIREALTFRNATEPRDVLVPEAAWLQIEFGDFDLGETGILKIEDVDTGELQTFNQQQLEAWGGMSAIFKSTHLLLSVDTNADAGGPLFYEIKRIFVGEPLEDRLYETPSGSEESISVNEVQCGGADNRQASTDLRVGRIMPVGCTGWIVGENTFLTAGHCVRNSMRILEFNVPDSNTDRTLNPAPVHDQYAIVQNSIVSNKNGVGDDWAVFRVAANTQTGLFPRAAQGAQFTLSNTLNPNQVTVTGYGRDIGVDDQTQQTDSGAFLGATVEGRNDVFIEYIVDTEGGNSGSPVISNDGSGQAIGIHTHGGCNPPNDGNKGTSFQHERLWKTIHDFNVEEAIVPVAYVHNDYDGRSQVLAAGSYNTDQLSIGNDVISSIKVPPGWKVTLYQHRHFWGTTRVLTADTTALPGFNDTTSSIVVERR